MAALLRTLAGSGRNVQGTAAPVHSLGRRDATPVEQRSQPGELRSSKCRPTQPSAFRVLLGSLGLELEPHDGLVADDPCVMTGLDDVGLA